MSNNSVDAGCQNSNNDDLQIIEVISGHSTDTSFNELNNDDISDCEDSIYEENSFEFQIYSNDDLDDEDDSNGRKKQSSYFNDSNQDEDDCIILDGTDEPNTSKKTCFKRNPIICKKKEIKIHCGMKVFALYDSIKHIWKQATVIQVKNSLTNAEQYKENSIKSKSNAKYLVKFDRINKQTTNNLIDEYDRTEIIQQNGNQESLNTDESTVFSVNSNSDSDDIIIVEDNNEPLEKRPKTSSQKTDDIVELDATCIAFINSGADNPIPNVPFIDFDQSIKTLILPVRSRIIALYKLHINDSDKNTKLIISEHMCSATIAEQPSSRNLKRYLVFFDNGFVSYISPQLVYPIFDLFRLPIKRLDHDHIYFIRYYFENYPERAMVRLEQNDPVKLFINNKWHETRVIDVDVSLVKLTLDIKMFDNLNNQRNLLINKRFTSNLNSHSIWFYRGSYRLLPLHEVITNKLAVKKSDESVELNQFEKYIKDKQKDPLFYQTKCLSTFASTSFPCIGPTSKYKIKRDKDELKVVQGQLKIVELESMMRNQLVKFRPHVCASSCVTKWEKEIKSVKGINPLLMPGMHGWQRHICHQSKTLNTASKKWINYMAPCGRSLRSTGEVDRYLYITNSKLTIDMFAFDCGIHFDREFESNSKYLKKDDIAEGKENMAISCVNCVDTIQPDNIEYSAQRIPLEGVPLDTSEDLMEGCSCEDNCRDRSKCACWRKTFESTTFTHSNQTNTSVGYRGRRLFEMVNTGIFECNSKCKCDCRCSNRVVQNGITLRLQLFKTSHKGWGLRCLDDIAKGTFVCIYAGHLMTEEQSDVRGVEYGDEFFAELDFVECLRRLKQGFINNSSSSTDSDSSNSNRLSNQVKIYKKSVGKNRLVPRKNPVSVTQNSEIDFIFLDSDEDEQDRNEHTMSALSNQVKDFERNRIRNREEKERKVTSSINSNRFFTNKNNPFFYGDYLKDSSIYIMDAKLCGNIGRYFNHSCSPNLFVQNVFVDTYDLRFPWIAFFALNSIKAGTELTWDYNYTIDSVEGRQLYCYCNSHNCRGRLI